MDRTYLRVVGFCYLFLHKLNRLANKTRRKKKRPLSPLIQFGFSLLNVIHASWFFPALIIAYLLVYTSPSGQDISGNWTVILFTFVVAIIIYLYRLHGVAGLLPQQWIRWLFRPVLVIQINLGHEKLDTKRLLFDIATLLQLRYQETLGLLSSNKLFRLVFFFFLPTLVLSNWIYHKTLTENIHAEYSIEKVVIPLYRWSDDALSKWLKVERDWDNIFKKNNKYGIESHNLDYLLNKIKKEEIQPLLEVALKDNAQLLQKLKNHNLVF